MNPDDPMQEDRCTECGAALGPAERCEDLLNRMLAIEWQLVGELRSAVTQAAFLESAIGAVYGRAHFLAVGAYQLQHPSRLEAAALLGLRGSVADVLSGRRTVADIRASNRRAYDGPRTVKRKGGPSPDPLLGRWPTAWLVTAADCCSVAAADYPAAVERFAATAVAAIDAVRPAVPARPQPRRPEPRPPRADRKPR